MKKHMGLTALAFLAMTASPALALPLAPHPAHRMPVQYYFGGPIFDDPDPILSEGRMIRLLARQGYQVIGPGRLSGDTARFPARDRHGRRVTVIADPYDGLVLEVWRAADEVEPPRSERPAHPRAAPPAKRDAKPKTAIGPKAGTATPQSAKPEPKPKPEENTPLSVKPEPQVQPKPALPSSSAPATVIPPPPFMVPPVVPPPPQNTLPIPIEGAADTHTQPRIVGPTPPAYALPQ